MDQIFQLVGAVLILVAFTLAQLHRLAPGDLAYLLLNLSGGAVLAVVAAAGADYGFLLLEVVWTAVSAAGLVRYHSARPAA